MIYMSTSVEMFCFVGISSETFVALRFSFNFDWKFSFGWFIIEVSLVICFCIVLRKVLSDRFELYNRADWPSFSYENFEC